MIVIIILMLVMIMSFVCMVYFLMTSIYYVSIIFMFTTSISGLLLWESIGDYQTAKSDAKL